MCILCNHEKKGGFENTAIGTWSKGISLIFCSSIFLLHFMNDEQLSVFNKTVPDGEYKMVYYLSIYNLIGASILLLLSVLGHFVYKIFLRPIYLSSFIVSLFLISSGVYTTSISKNISLKIIGIMDALKYHPDYMLLNKINNMDKIGHSIIIGTESLVLKEVDDRINSIPVTETSHFDATKILDMIKNPELFLDTKKDKLLKTLTREDLMKLFKNIPLSNPSAHKIILENTLLELYEKIKNIRIHFDIYDNFYKFVENNSSVFITNSEKIKNFAQKFRNIYNYYNKSFFNISQYELVKHDNDIIKIYLDSIEKIKNVQKKNRNAKLDEYIDDLKKRNILIIASTLLLMSFIYIHKGATLTTQSSMSITLMYAPSMSYLITLACIFVYFNEGSKVYNEYKKNDYNDFYWVLLNRGNYEHFKSFVLFSNGQMFLVTNEPVVFLNKNIPSTMLLLLCVFTKKKKKQKKQLLFTIEKILKGNLKASN
ncbi:conserved Plasmodium protein, unknown function [Plasmodium ovale curtisi]|uniref:Uncharacterized protein n=1 Tax=Plasmodium ovale curtisi TaxID=864141 RepID=A0A1A8WVA0_PLAOA|nr:conserved Plasmodium protein, unknown function [Plasmodium ovale curtisi]SBS96857.1 conserved Plasmodium protein, unknown function [Plasmodium ovale curtisi]